MANFANGRIPASAMTALSVGGRLLPAAAANFELWRAEAKRSGRELTITSAADAFRTYEIQERIFRERFTTTYLPGRPTKNWQGRTWWLKPGQAMAAVPGTSNHGKGLAVDIRNAGSFNGAFYKWMVSTGPKYGWSNAEGRSIGEPWHWVNDNAPRGAVASIPGIIPDQKDDDMSAQDVAVLRADMNTLHTLLNEILNATGVLYRDIPARVVPATVDAIMNTPIQRAGGTPGVTTLAAVLAYYDTNVVRILDQPDAAPSQVDVESVTQAVAEKLAELTFTLTPKE